MARKLTSYPTIFERITRKALVAMDTTGPTGPPLLVIPCGGSNKAVNVQMQLRQYWKALREAYMAGLLQGVAGVEDIAPRAANLACRYTPDRTGVEVIHKNQMAVSKLLANALDAMEESLTSLEGRDPRAGNVGVRPANPDSEIEEAYGLGGAEELPKK